MGGGGRGLSFYFISMDRAYNASPSRLPLNAVLSPGRNGRGGEEGRWSGVPGVLFFFVLRGYAISNASWRLYVAV